MKKIYLLSFCLLFAFITANAQERFLEKTFDVDITTNIPYGENYTVITVPVLGKSTLETLMMDVYQPAGDDAEERPLVVYLHTGNFLPIITNGSSSGTRSDSATVEICKRMAELGYVVASIDYRLGWNPFGATQPERAFSLINAAYRGVQDMRTAIRYFRNDFANDNLWRVDTSRITAFGQGTGGYISLGCAVLDEYLEIPVTQNPVGKFLTDLDGDPTTLEPMIIPTWNGDIYGTSLGIAPTGDTLCVPNWVGESSDFDLCINLGGAIPEISWMEEGDVPIISFHAPNDQFAPYYDDILRVGTNNDAVVQVQGSQYVAEMANDLGNNDVFLGIDDEWTDGAIRGSANAGHEYMEALYPLVRPQNALGNYESAPWEWWNPSPFDTIPHPFVTGSSIHEVQLAFNLSMSANQARTYIDTIVNYIAPRAYRALDLENWSSSIDLLNAADVELEMAPNPAMDIVTIQAGSEFKMQSIEVYTMNGKVVSRIDDINSSVQAVDVSSLQAGVYQVAIRFNDGVVTQKLSVIH